VSYLKKSKGAEGAWFGDTGFLHAAGGVCAIYHLGYGDFRVEYGEHDITFIRVDHVVKTENFEGAIGRMHRVSGLNEAIEAIIAAVEAANAVDAKIAASPE